MGLADTLADRPHPNAGCAAGRMLAQIDDDVRAEIVEAMHDRRVSDTVLAGWVADEGLVDDPPGSSSYGRHRRRACRCDFQ